jgi:hypothetical protein
MSKPTRQEEITRENCICNTLNRYNPKNRAMALSYQLTDCARMLYSFSIANDEQAVLNCLQQMEMHIKVSRQAGLMYASATWQSR